MTGSESVRLERASPEMHGLLANLLELYSHDLSDIFSIDVGADGRFGYAKLQLYWSSPETRHAFLIRCDGSIAGFVLVTRGSPMTDDPSDLDVAEFFVLRKYRRIGVGSRAVQALWDSLPGRWVVRVSEANRAALPFWAGVVRQYTGGACSEVTRSSGDQLWRVFSFDSADIAV